MKKTPLQSRIICFVLALSLLMSMFGVSAFAATDDDYSYKREDTESEHKYSASTLEQMQALIGTLTYDEYLANYKDQYAAHLSNLQNGLITENDKVVIDVVNDYNPDASAPAKNKPITTVANSETCQSWIANHKNDWANFAEGGLDDPLYDETLYLPDQGTASWNVKNIKEGFYYIKIEYFSATTEDSRNSSIERQLMIQDRVPFSEVGSLKLDKNWKFETDYTEPPVDTDEPDSYDVKYEQRDDGYYRIITEVENGKRYVTVSKISQDINGNSMSSAITSVPSWNTYYVKDSSGYHDGYLKFYFEGDSRISLQAEREPMVIKSIELIPAVDEEELITYDKVLEMYAEKGYKPATNGKVIEIQAEFPDLISDSSVAPSNDNTSAINYPISSSAQLYNVIGETGYNSMGQWAAYKFKVTETGLYNISARYKQSALQGMYICRTIKINGGIYGEADGTPEVPFAEAYSAEFNYSNKWQSEYLSFKQKREGTDKYDYIPMMFYFEEGVEYTVYFECSLGSLKEYIQRVETSLDKINSCYLRILQLTGTEPDEDRPYGFADNMPEVLITLLEEAMELMAVKEGLEELCGTNGSHTATLETIARLLNTMGKDDGIDIAANMSTFKSYLGTLGTWINDSKRSSLTVDSYSIIPAVEKNGEYTVNKKALPKANANIFHTIWFEIKAFISSFFVKYDQMGLTVEPDEDTLTIDVWLATGRDQSQIWRTMIDSDRSYTSSTGTAVSLKLVTAGTLLPSILSRKGPDVYMGLASGDVINYAIRDAVLGVSGNSKQMDAESNAIFTTETYSYRNDDGTITTTDQKREGEEPTFESHKFEDVVKNNFASAAMDTVTLLDVTYGIPQTMSFAMMFYRMDVLANLGIRVPESWNELLSILPVLQTNNMSIGVSYLEALDFMIYQQGGSMWKYTDPDEYDSKYAGARVDLDSQIAKDAFEFTCRLYSDYSFPVSYDASNRFRTGEMPIIIGGYSGIYNTLKVYATEIEGLWEFCSLPGSQRADGTFNYDSLAYVTASVILYGCEGKELEAAWQFLQWQTSEDAQAEYGNKMVALIGPSAKYETANLNAIDKLSWTASEKDAIMNQMDNMSSIVNYPGSYIINRYMQFAFFDAVNDGAEPVDSLLSYIDAINKELQRKRDEFKDAGLWSPEDDSDEPESKGTKSIE